jgi:hypothetical protein
LVSIPIQLPLGLVAEIDLQHLAGPVVVDEGLSSVIFVHADVALGGVDRLLAELEVACHFQTPGALDVQHEALLALQTHIELGFLVGLTLVNGAD